MKSRFYLFALAALLFVAPSGLAQLPPGAGNGGVGPINGPGSGSTVQARVFTSAVLVDAAQNVIGKAKTTTIQTSDRGTFEGLRVQITGLTPNTEYALVIDGTLVGTDTADANGAVRFKFAAPTNGRIPAIPDAIKPIANARTVQIFEVANQRLADSGSFSTGRPSK